MNMLSIYSQSSSKFILNWSKHTVYCEHYTEQMNICLMKNQIKKSNKEFNIELGSGAVSFSVSTWNWNWIKVSFVCIPYDGKVLNIFYFNKIHLCPHRVHHNRWRIFVCFKIAVLCDRFHINETFMYGVTWEYVLSKRDLTMQIERIAFVHVCE